ncbi:NPCBM/NEW2 domain-containing protein [Streptomyces zaomyceticus]|uniref:NPCBM/NEW2 domain-containing protein n=1 Tax=Streptomyces zaomyceticus TaxID=68286 RepID=UPI003716CCAC
MTDLTPLKEEQATLEIGPQTVNLKSHPLTMYSVCSQTTWQLDRKYASFTARYGVTDDWDKVPEQFTIRVDGAERLHATKDAGNTPGKVTLDVSNAFRITLETWPCYPYDPGFAVWIDPVLTAK